VTTIYSKAGADAAISAATDALTPEDVGADPAGTAAAAIAALGLGTAATTDATAYAPTLGAQPYYLDAYTAFFGGAANTFKSGQSVTPTTLTADVAAGATVLPVASATGLVAGTVLVTGAGTATQQLLVVVSVASLNVTVSAAVGTALTNGASVAPLWTNSSHLTADGYNAFAYFIVNAKKTDGTYVMTDPGAVRPVVFLGDSWIVNGGASYATQVHARFPSAVVVNAGVAGNSSGDMIDRFATDVPTNARYVIINEPGINDMYGTSVYTAEKMAANLDTLIRLIRGIGATPIVTGPAPYVDFPGRAASLDIQMRAQVSGGSTYPAVGLSAMLAMLNRQQGAGSIGFGPYVQQVCTGINNTGVGYQCQLVLTTGTQNTGQGSTAQASLTTGVRNTAVGAVSQFSLTTGQHNTGVGALSMYAGGGLAANATTTGSYQTCVGAHTGQASATQVDYIAALGYKAAVTASGGVAIGTDSGGAGAVAVAVNEFALGTANHLVKVRGRLNVAQRTPTGSADASGTVGDIASDDSYIYAKTSTGWKRAALSTW
jgi:hypothetical protein